MLFFFVVFSLVRIPYLPQFVDGYYHLSAANGFIRSGGWVGWSWWDFAPVGRPQLYPPLYHLLLAAMIKAGIKGITALKLTEGLITPVFFVFLWMLLRRLFNSRTACIALAALSSFFPFYTSVSGNVPASIALVLGFLSLLFVARGRLAPAVVALAMAFYTHAGIPWIFVIGYLIWGICDGAKRRIIFVMTGGALLLALPFFIHLARYAADLHITPLAEEQFVRYSIFMITGAAIGAVLAFKEKGPALFFTGLAAGAAIIFFRYAYRFFCAQGILPLGVLAAFASDKALERFKNPRAAFGVVFLAVLVLAAVHPSLRAGASRPAFEGRATYASLMRGDIEDNLMFQSMYFPKFDAPVARIIKKHTGKNDIITSNIRIVAQTFSALCDRANSNAMLGEVAPGKDFDIYANARLAVWVDLDGRAPDFARQDNWSLLKDAGVYKIYLNRRGLVVSPPTAPAWFNLYFLFALIALCLAFLFYRAVAVI